MTTIIIKKINERIKIGKAFMALIEAFLKEKKKSNYLFLNILRLCIARKDDTSI